MTVSSTTSASIILGGCLAASVVSGQVFAIGDDSSTTPTCKKGEIYDQKTKKCVKQQSAKVSDENRADYAYSLAKAGRYEEALVV
ncbi:hypothetical protein AB9F42_34260, partial [Rhizobium leguminosarum]